MTCDACRQREATRLVKTTHRYLCPRCLPPNWPASTVPIVVSPPTAIRREEGP